MVFLMVVLMMVLMVIMNVLLAQLFLEKTPSYSFSLGIDVIMQKLWHFVISLPLLNIYTWNSKYVHYEKGNMYKQVR